MLKLIIFKEDDRLTVAAILVKNGYTVRTGKERKINNGKETKAYNYFVETVDQVEVDETDES